VVRGSADAFRGGAVELPGNTENLMSLLKAPRELLSAEYRQGIDKVQISKSLKRGRTNIKNFYSLPEQEFLARGHHQQLVVVLVNSMLPPGKPNKVLVGTARVPLMNIGRWTV
ncbi:unnamed protein product, partial [Amoebophrya sp. A25]